MTALLWTDSHRRAWAPLKKLLPSEWAEKYRVLPSSSAEPGALSLNRTPHMRGILDATMEPGVEFIVVPKATQITMSTGIETLIGWTVDNDPGPMLYVLDSEPSADAVMEERIRPMTITTPTVAAHLPTSPHDSTLDKIRFDTCDLFMGHAGSVGSLARRAIRRLFLDEVDKYPPHLNKEADPISLAIERTQTFGHRRLIVMCSSPTTREGYIWKAWEACGDKRTYHVPCPICGEYQVMTFAQLRWPDGTTADDIMRQDLAGYCCKKCGASIKDTQRYKMLERGRWISQGQTIDARGVVTSDKPKAKSIGFKPDCFLSPWRTFSAIAAEFVKSKGNPSAMQNFRNSWLAEPFEVILKSRSLADTRALLVGAPPPLSVPDWAEFIVSSADVHDQKKAFVFAIRAWGARFKSQLIHHGRCESFEELRRICLDQAWAFMGKKVQPHLLAIDSGYRTSEVYDFSREDPRIRPIKGDNDTQTQLVKLSDRAAEFGVPLYKANTQMLKDKLAWLQAEGGKWLLNSAVDDEYLRQLSSEHKVIIKGREMWVKKSPGLANEALDIEVYSLAGAEILGVAALEESTVEQQPEESEPTEERGKSWLGERKGWI
jgi:phage terminase large subunit GpA-like protein